MTQANLEMLQALEMAGVPKEEARAAAASVAADAATKADLAALETRLTRQHYSGLAVLLAAIAIATAVG